MPVEHGKGPEILIEQAIAFSKAMSNFHLHLGELKKGLTPFRDISFDALLENDPNNTVLTEFKIAEVFKQTEEQLSSTLLFLRRGITRTINPQYRNYTDEQIDEVIKMRTDNELEVFKNLPKTQ